MKPSETSVALALYKNRKEIIQYTGVLIIALQEALDYDPGRHHNMPIPALRINDAKYLSDIRLLAKELRRLNKLLEQNIPQRGTNRVAREAGKYLTMFLSNYTPLLAKSSAVLTIGVIVSLLHKLGVGTGDVDQIIATVLKGHLGH